MLLSCLELPGVELANVSVIESEVAGEWVERDRDPRGEGHDHAVGVADWHVVTHSAAISACVGRDDGCVGDEKLRAGRCSENLQLSLNNEVERCSKEVDDAKSKVGPWECQVNLAPA